MSEAVSDSRDLPDPRCRNCDEPVGHPHVKGCPRACPHIENDKVHLVDVPTKVGERSS